MPARSLIGKLTENGVRYIHCHFDGYPAGVGSTLLESCRNERMLERLLDLGDISVLGSNPISRPSFWDPFNFQAHSGEWTIAYKDRGEKGTESKTSSSVEGFLEKGKSVAEYCYLYSPEGGWSYCEASEGKLKPLNEEEVESGRTLS